MSDEARSAARRQGSRLVGQGKAPDKIPASESAAKPSLWDRWRENRIGPYFHRDFRFGWLGYGWNAVRLGWMTFYLGSGPSPLARLRSRLGR